MKSKIKWEKSNSPYYTRNIWMAEGHGYSWFRHGTIPGQEVLREKLNLEGGDDRIQLAMDGLALEDEGSMTRHSCRYIPAKFGDRSLLYVRKAIEQAEGVELSDVVGCLAYLRTKKATALLLELYNSEDENMRNAAEYALIHEPFRPEAKQAYFDMLKRQSRVNHATKASLEFGWKDSRPCKKYCVSYQHSVELCSPFLDRRVDPWMDHWNLVPSS